MEFSPLSFFIAPLIFNRIFKSRGDKRLTPQEAEAQAKEILLSAKDEAIRIKERAEQEANQVRRESLEAEEKVKQRRQKLQQRARFLKAKIRQIKKREKEINQKQAQIKKLAEERLQQLEQVTKLSREEAQEQYLAALEKELTEEAAQRIRENEEKIKQESEEKTREILVTALQRVGTEHVPASTVSEVKLPNDDLKGRIIGKEGRNIKALESATGVSVEIGDEEGIVTVSSFDPVRREVARMALTRLIADGRIQPSRIEEIVEKVRDEVYQIVHKAGEDLAYQAKVYDLPREVIDLLGKFKYRTSYGQSMWEHTLEVVRLGEALAAELGARVELVRKACLLHDIGKAVTTETEKGHAQVGADLARRHGIAEEVVRTFEGHHTEDFPNLEAVIVYLADAISGARPGARREDYEAYIQRIAELENIANQFAGVDKAYALSAGREVRVIVRPQDVSDAEMVKLAHDISRRIREQVQAFPAPIKVNVIRETRAGAIAKPKSE